MTDPGLPRPIQDGATAGLWDGIPLGFGNGEHWGLIISKVTFGYIYSNDGPFRFRGMRLAWGRAVR